MAELSAPAAVDLLTVALNMAFLAAVLADGAPTAAGAMALLVAVAADDILVLVGALAATMTILATGVASLNVVFSNIDAAEFERGRPGRWVVLEYDYTFAELLVLVCVRSVVQCKVFNCDFHLASYCNRARRGQEERAEFR
jgi:hypothetical protein